MQIAVDEAPKVIRWVERADDLSWLPVDGDAGWSTLEELDPAINDLLVECGQTYAPFLVANAQALASGADEVVCQIASDEEPQREYRQAPFGYQGKCLAWLRDAYATLSETDRGRVDVALQGTGCEQLFTDSLPI
jgi:hypothetical protein